MVKHNEPAFLEQLRRRVRIPAGSELVMGIGDDCAILRPRGARHDLLFTTDMLLEGVHFQRDSHTAHDVGWKALARGLSDIAAMGGTPTFCLLSLALGEWADRRWIAGFYDGLLAHGTPLAGGDLARADRMMCDIVVAGTAPRGKALRRDGARAGDAIFVSGVLGGSALGLETRRGRAWSIHKRPRPRLALGRFLRERLHATAAMDLSDGLSMDLYRLAKASGLAAEIAMPPVFPGASAHHALHGGEDYELLFTVREGVRVPAEVEGIQLTRIGSMRRGRAGLVSLDGTELQPLGWDHLR